MNSLAEIQAYDRQVARNFVKYYIAYAETNSANHIALDTEVDCIFTALQTAFGHNMLNTFIRGTVAFHQFLETRGF